ncbi:MAG: NAD(P)H-quinone oxidoreductase [Verrucomicrobia bacterium]|nr:NAD(P)H-quinone oxidoreductase [Verrucomicrobiota bacterium]MDA1065227.1 NAD(P)H-quinone oxidoreductase [Verrucomicrobiota bacterium]
MKAICVDPDTHAISWTEVCDPAPAPGEVVIDIHASAVNRADLLQRMGKYPVPPDAPPYMGLEAAGVISELGEGVTRWQVGDRVCTLLGGGGYAERVATPASMLIRMPDDWDFEKAAAVPEVFYTAFLNLFIEGELKEGETVLIHGGASGVGTAGIQLAKRAGCRVLVTAGRADKIDFCKQLGADVAVNYKEEDFETVIRKEAPDGVAVILDIAAADYLKPNMKLLKTRGRLVIIALLTGTKAEIDLSLLMRGRQRVIGSVLRSRSLEEKVAIHDRFEESFWPDLVSGLIKPIIYKTLPIEETEAAQNILANNENIGKVILKVRD